MAGHLAEVSVRLVSVHSVKICPVEYVEEFEAELEIDPLGDGCVFKQRGVPLIKAGLTETVVRLISFYAKGGGRCEGASGEKAVQVALASGGVMVAIHVWEVEVIAIRVIVAAAGSIAGKVSSCIFEGSEGRIGRNRERASRLNNGGSAELPSAGSATDQSQRVIDIGKLVIPGK